MLPVFVPLNGNVIAKLEELQKEKEELQKEMKQPAPAAYPAKELAIPSPATPSACDGHNHPPPDMQDEQPQKKRRHVLDRALLLLPLLPLHMLSTWMVPCRWKRGNKSRKSEVCSGNWHTGSVLLLRSCHGTPHNHNQTFSGRCWSQNSHASLSLLVDFYIFHQLLLLLNVYGPALDVWLASNRARSIPPLLHKSCSCATMDAC